MGRIIYIPAWPALYIYLRFGGERTRVIVTGDDKILLVKDWLGDGSWSLPGGGLHKGEAVNIGAARELMEETGLQVDPKELKLLGRLTLRGRGFRITSSYFLLRLSAIRPVKPQGHEIIEVRWLRLNDVLQQHRLSSNTRQLIEEWHG